MKKIILSSIVLSVLLTGVALAEVTSTASKINAIKASITELKQQASENNANLKAKIASTTSTIKNIRQDLKSAIEIRIGKKLDAQKLKIANVFENTIQNLKDLITRIESRMTKMEANNINVSSSKTLLDSAKSKVTLAETELTNFANLLAQDIPAIGTSTAQNTARKTILQNIKTESEKTKTAIKTAQLSIIKVVTSLKAGLLKENTTSTSTATTTN